MFPTRATLPTVPEDPRRQRGRGALPLGPGHRHDRRVVEVLEPDGQRRCHHHPTAGGVDQLGAVPAHPRRPDDGVRRGQHGGFGRMNHEWRIGDGRGAAGGTDRVVVDQDRRRSSFHEQPGKGDALFSHAPDDHPLGDERLQVHDVLGIVGGTGASMRRSTSRSMSPEPMPTVRSGAKSSSTSPSVVSAAAVGARAAMTGEPAHSGRRLSSRMAAADSRRSPRTRRVCRPCSSGSEIRRSDQGRRTCPAR